MAKTYYMRWIAVLLLAFSTQSKAGEWTNKDIGIETTYAILHVIDWGQTLSVDCQNHFENNPILGTCPTRSKTNLYFATTLLLHALISDQLHGNWRTAFQVITVGVELNSDIHNARLGVKINF